MRDPIDLGYLAGVIDTDAGFYTEPRRGGRRLVLEVEVASEGLAGRIQRLLDAVEIRPRTREQRGPFPPRTTYRVRVRVGKAEAILREVFPHVTRETQDKILTRFDEAELEYPDEAA